MPQTTVDAPSHTAPTLDGGGSGRGVEGPILISNEFADVVVTRVRTRNGVRLEIFSPRRGSRIQLDAVVLDCLSYQQPEVFTDLITRTPGA